MEMVEKKGASKGVAGAGLGLGIAGTALGLGLFNGTGLFGRNATPVGGCTEVVALTSAIYEGRIVELQERFADRNVINGELFALYKSGRDADDEINKRISTLEAAAILTHERTINYIDKLDCMNIKGAKYLPDTPVASGFVSIPSCNGCCC